MCRKYSHPRQHPRISTNLVFAYVLASADLLALAFTYVFASAELHALVFEYESASADMRILTSDPSLVSDPARGIVGRVTDCGVRGLRFKSRARF